MVRETLKVAAFMVFALAWGLAALVVMYLLLALPGYLLALLASLAQAQ